MPAKNRDKAIISYLLESAWAMHEETLSKLTDIVSRHAEGSVLDPEQIEKIINDGKASRDSDAETYDQYTRCGDAGIIPIHGVIAKHSSQVNGLSQPAGTSCEQINEDIDRALADPKVNRIILHVESPGGSVSGVADTAARIAEANEIKPVTAYASDHAHSGAYWLASQAGEFYASRSAWVGSIGVYAVLADTSRRSAKYGVSYKVLRTGRFKGVGAAGNIEGEDLGDMQTRIDAVHELFTADVAEGRGVEIETIEPIADGRSITGTAAVEAGLIDGICAFSEVLDNSATPVQEPASAKADNNDNGLDGDNVMAKQKEADVTNEQLEQAKLQAADEAVTKERERIMAVTKVLAGHPDLLEKAIADPNCGDEKAQAMLVPKLEARVKELTEQIADRDQRLAKIAEGGNNVVSQQSDEKIEGDKDADAKASTGDDDGKAATYIAAVKQLKSEGKSKAKAMIEAGKSLPKSHQAWIDDGSKDF